MYEPALSEKIVCVPVVQRDTRYRGLGVGVAKGTQDREPYMRHVVESASSYYQKLKVQKAESVMMNSKRIRQYLSRT